MARMNKHVHFLIKRPLA